jgi:dipeptidyl aminopeptidase/acylaminoacyl peptidase
MLIAAALFALVAPLVTAADARRVVGLESPAISPDGRRAALVIDRVVWSSDRNANDLIVVDLQTRGSHTVLRDGNDLSEPAFSPDGSRLAYLADDPETDRTEVFVVASGRTATQVTHWRSDVTSFAWRPDGGAIAFTAAEPRTPARGSDRFRNSFIFTTEPITARSRPQSQHLYVQPIGGGKVAQLTFGEESVADDSPLSWSPDGREIALTLARNTILNDQSYSRVAIVNAGSRALRYLTGRTMWESNARFSPDGRYVAYLYSDGDPQVALTQLYVTTPNGGPGTAISSTLDRSIGDAVWSSDSQSLVATAPDGLTNALWRISLDGKAQRYDVGDLVPGIPLTTTGGAESPELGAALARDGTLAFVGTATAQPPELYIRRSNGTVMRATALNAALAHLSWASAERVTFPTATRMTADGVLYKPPGFQSSSRYPLVVYIHGGPDDPSMREFDIWAQVMAARGWVVLRPNYRGSPNLGLRYQRAILYDPEDGPSADVMAAIATVRAMGIVDDRRIAVCGWSYGGILTAWLISKYHIWSAAVSGASVNDWITDYGTADDSLADRDLLHGSPFVGDNADEWRRISAITYAADVTTPVLLLSDTADNRDPFATTSMYWRALRDNGKDAVLRVWPVAGHFPSDPVRTDDVYRYWIDFIAQHFGAPYK